MNREEATFYIIKGLEHIEFLTEAWIREKINLEISPPENKIELINGDLSPIDKCLSSENLYRVMREMESRGIKMLDSQNPRAWGEFIEKYLWCSRIYYRLWILVNLENRPLRDAIETPLYGIRINNAIRTALRQENLAEGMLHLEKWLTFSFKCDHHLWSLVKRKDLPEEYIFNQVINKYVSFLEEEISSTISQNIV